MTVCSSVTFGYWSVFFNVFFPCFCSFTASIWLTSVLVIKTSTHFYFFPLQFTNDKTIWEKKKNFGYIVSTVSAIIFVVRVCKCVFLRICFWFKNSHLQLFCSGTKEECWGDPGGFILTQLYSMLGLLTSLGNCKPSQERRQLFTIYFSVPGSAQSRPPFSYTVLPKVQ